MTNGTALIPCPICGGDGCSDCLWFGEMEEAVAEYVLRHLRNDDYEDNTDDDC